MTNSDQLMLAAVKAGVSFRINGREVAVEEDKTTVRLLDEPVASLSFREGLMTLKGRTPVSRKSARVFNTLLREYTDFQIMSRNGQWILKGMSGEMLPLNDIGVTIPIRNRRVE